MTQGHQRVQAALPSFRRPPVVEVVIGAQMVGAEPHSLQALGRFAASLADEGLSVQEARPAVEVPPERFDPAEMPVVASLDVLLGSGPPPVCHVMRSAAGDEMVQVQTDWIAVNWRKASADSEYPRWPSRWDTFERRARLAQTCFGGSDFRFGVVEVTYLNHIELDDATALHSQPARVLSFLAAGDEFTDGFLGPAERCHAGLDFRIGQSGDDRPAGPADRLGQSGVASGGHASAVGSDADGERQPEVAFVRGRSRVRPSRAGVGRAGLRGPDHFRDARQVGTRRPGVQ